MNNGTVEFTDFDGNTQLTLPPKNSNRGPKKFQEPSVATILLGRKSRNFIRSVFDIFILLFRSWPLYLIRFKIAEFWSEIRVVVTCITVQASTKKL